jgi:nucleoside-diphosphate-sugar epimerase
MMHVLVTGGAGYIGSTLTSHLLQRGMAVKVLDRLVYGGAQLLPFSTDPRFELIAGDVRDERALSKALDGVQAVIHLAAVVGEPACAVDEAEARSINFDGTAAVLAGCASAGIPRLLFASTCSNYGVSNPGMLATEDAPLNPLSQYARAKTEAEWLLLGSPANVVTTVLRFGTICGVSPRMRFDLLVSELARAAALRQRIEVFAPEAWRPFLHIRDAARAIEQCLAAPTDRIHKRVFNVVGENVQKQSLVKLVHKHFPDAPVAVVEKAPDIRDYRVSGERIEHELGFKPRHSIQEAFLETAEAIVRGVFRDPMWLGHSAIPDPDKLRWTPDGQRPQGSPRVVAR